MVSESRVACEVAYVCTDFILHTFLGLSVLDLDPTRDKQTDRRQTRNFLTALQKLCRLLKLAAYNGDAG